MTLLRPHVLWFLLPVAVLWAFMVWRRGSELRAWRPHVAPHLLAHLVVGASGRRGLRPIHLLGTVLVLAILAAAGPAWRREPSPFTADEATLIVAVDLSSTMVAKDIRPSRYERALQKVRDLVDARPGARTGLIAFAGSAHTVLPPTRDPKLLTTFAEALSPDLMPKPGRNPTAALALAEKQLAAQGPAGTIVFFTDGPIPRSESGQQVLVLAVGRNLELDAPGAQVTSITVDDRDVRTIARQAATHFVAAQSEDATARWRDEGPWMAWPLALLMLFWFRRGWVVTWD